VRHQPRQIYTSVRSPDGLAGAAPSDARRRLVIALLMILAVATIVVVILSLL
jgi:hypothetical protein